MSLADRDPEPLPLAMSSSPGVLFVCTGNICRSPTAEGVFSGLLKTRGLSERIRVDSAGTHDYHPGKRPDPRSRLAAERRGYGIDHLRARVVEQNDFADFDYVLAMDRNNYHDLVRMCPDAYRSRLHMMLAFAPQLRIDEVPDPYFGNAGGFETVLDIVEIAVEGLIDHVVAGLRDEP